MKKIISISIISSIILMAGSPIHDLMDSRIKGKSYSGSLNDNAAAEDGLGILPLQSYGTTTDVNNELLVQKILSRINKSEIDKTKTVNIKSNLIGGTVGSSSDLSYYNSLVTGSSSSPTALGSLSLLQGFVPSDIVYEGYPYTDYKNFNSKIFERSVNINWTDWTSVYSHGMYWYQPGRYLEMTLPEGAIIYTRNLSSPTWVIDDALNVFKDGQSRDDLWLSTTGRGINWVQTTKSLPAGKYKFINTNGQSRFDTDWYIYVPNTNTTLPTSFVSCKTIKDSYPTATDGIYNLNGIGDVYCDMTTDGGGWTTFFAGKNDAVNVFAKFESGNNCTSPDSQCLRRIPSNISTANEFAASCGSAMVAFNVNSNIISFLQTGTQYAWQNLTNMHSIGSSGISYIPTQMWTGSGSNQSWILSTNTGAYVNQTFSSSYNYNNGWDYCNSVHSSANNIKLYYR